MPCFYLTPKKNDFNQIPGRLSGMTAFGRKQAFVNVQKRPRLCENSEISHSAKNFSHFASNTSPATVPS